MGISYKVISYVIIAKTKTLLTVCVWMFCGYYVSLSLHFPSCLFFITLYNYAVCKLLFFFWIMNALLFLKAQFCLWHCMLTWPTLKWTCQVVTRLFTLCPDLPCSWPKQPVLWPQIKANVQFLYFLSPANSSYVICCLTVLPATYWLTVISDAATHSCLAVPLGAFQYVKLSPPTTPSTVMDDLPILNEDRGERRLLEVYPPQKFFSRQQHPFDRVSVCIDWSPNLMGVYW